ncbi:hypothetical protein D9758_013322 [Tetrapyrgos nigripes]|uniref:Uncharacterized protein n=1 Tax=Tetrapyrgos nigripes TaxID=182062 RepID=A0A8H5FK25_9AGAR|nr:hypothetical protein D9758_013322 [Tetrapyrgos nigripes]
MSPPTQPKNQHAYTSRFPPFPALPKGVTLVSYTDFKECGIRVRSVDGKEVDGIGIPTVKLSKKHDTDECKSDARPKKSPVAPVAVQPEQVRKVWYGTWEETEDTRRVCYDGTENPLDRIRSATRDFIKGRSWPHQDTGIRALFDQIQQYIGSSTINTPAAASQKVTKAENDDEDNSDDESFVDSLSNADDKLLEFLNDPGRSVQVFLSTYMRKRGLHHSLQKVTIFPRLWRFYINFFLRNRVLPNPEKEASLLRALEYVELAAEELPRTLEIARCVPDSLCKAFVTCFGVLDWSPDSGYRTTSDSDEDKTETQLLVDAMTGNVNENDSEDGWATAKDNLWGDWDNNNVDIGNIAQTVWDIQDEWKPEPDTLLKYLGPTLLPLTHTSGVMEWSARRIESITPPSPRSLSDSSSALAKDEDERQGPTSDGVADNEAVKVELELQRRFSKVVLSPWIGWDDPNSGEPEVALPCIHELSRGKVIVKEGEVVFEGRNPEDLVSVDSEEGFEEEFGAGLVLKPHDPLKDDITILLEPASAEKFKVGMGIAGRWVQMARRGDLDVQAKAQVETQVSNVGKDKASLPSQERFWFMATTSVILPSYHVV